MNFREFDEIRVFNGPGQCTRVPQWSTPCPPPPTTRVPIPTALSSFMATQAGQWCLNGVTVVNSGSPGFFWLQRVLTKPAHFVVS